MGSLQVQVEFVSSIKATRLPRTIGGRKTPIVASDLGLLLTWKEDAQVGKVYPLHPGSGVDGTWGLYHRFYRLVGESEDLYPWLLRSSFVLISDLN